MNRKGLGRFGFAKTVLRAPATDDDGYNICGECGHPVGRTLQGHEVAHPEVVDDEFAEEIGDSLVVYGYKCDRHSGYSVVMPTHIGQRDPEKVIRPGWTSIRVKMVDGFVRSVAVPRREIIETPGDAASGPEERGSA